MPTSAGQSHNIWNFVSKLPRSYMKCQSRGQISREIHRCCCLVIFSPQTSLKMRRVKASIYLPCSKHYTLLAFLDFHKFPNFIVIKIKVFLSQIKMMPILDITSCCAIKDRHHFNLRQKTFICITMKLGNLWKLRKANSV